MSLFYNPRMAEAFARVQHGQTMRDVARAMGLGYHTVRTYCWYMRRELAKIQAAQDAAQDGSQP